MADLSSNYTDGNIKWMNKNSFNATNLPTLPSSTERIITGLIATDIKTDVQNISVKIVKSNNIVVHFILSEIASIDLIGNQLMVFSSDELPILLEFTSLAEAQSADNRFTTCLNGGVVL